MPSMLKDIFTIYLGKNKIYSFKPDYIMIMPWNLKDEIIKEVKKGKFTGKFLTFIPDIKVYQ